MILFVLLGYFVTLQAENRFPKPEFKKGHTQPHPTQPAPQVASDPIIALGVLVVVMALTAYILYWRRSRKELRILIVLSLLYFGFFHGGCICSIGSIQNVAQSLLNPAMALPLTVLGAFLLPLLAALFMGRIFCGAACPLGAIQELVIQKHLRVPPLLDRCLKQIPFLYLGLAVLFATCGLGYIICQYDPFVGFFRFSATPNMLFFGAFLLILGTVVPRPYCRYLCPYSVLLKLTSKLSPRKVRITPDYCNNCQLCHEACPIGAIHPPRPRKYTEGKERALGRLQWLVALSPALVAMGILLGALLVGPLSRLHPDLELLRQLEAKNTEYEPVSAFLMQGGKIDDLRQRAYKARKRLNYGASLFGGYLALIFIGAMMAATRRRTNEEYDVDGSECISCAQCYRWCPVELGSEKGLEKGPDRSFEV